MICKVMTIVFIRFIVSFFTHQSEDADTSIIRLVTPDNRLILLYPDKTWEYASVDSTVFSFLENADTMGVPELKFKNIISAKVMGCKDGDTFDVLIERPVPGLGERETVRLLGVDAPELDRDEFFASDAAIYTERRLKSERIYLILGSRSRDSFCRLLAYVFLKDGTFLNVDLLSKGYARLFSRVECSLHDRFVSIQNVAMEQRVGLWGEHEPNITILYVYNHAREEHIVIANNSKRKVDLSGWSVKDREDNVLNFPEAAVIEPHGLIKIYTGENGIDDPPKAYYPVTENIWGNDGDSAYLFDSEGDLIDKYEY